MTVPEATRISWLMSLTIRESFRVQSSLERVWSYDYLGDSRLVDVAVQRLRAKIEDNPARPHLIRTVRSVGYKLDATAGDG